jgi:HSP20 family protein
MWLPEANDLAADVHRAFDDLERTGRGGAAGTSIHAPDLDVVETPVSIDIVVDVPGVDPGALRLVFKQGALIIVGEKHAPAAAGADGSAFHLVERSFGRFARVVRFDQAIDAARAHATYRAGVLRVSVPRIVERRGREISVPIDVSTA